MLNRSVIAFAFALALVLAAPAKADAVVIGTDTPGVEGNTSGLSGPLTTGAGYSIQMLWGSSLLGGLAPGSTITGLRFRIDADLSGGGNAALAADFGNYDMMLSSGPGVGSMGTSFASNLGANQASVRTGPLSIPAASFTSGATPNLFGFLVNFTAPYVYAGGDLLLTLRHDGASAFLGNIDARTGSDISLFPAQTLVAGSYAAVTGTVISPFGAIAQLEFTPVPLPGSLVLLLSALAVGFKLVRRRGEVGV